MYNQSDSLCLHYMSKRRCCCKQLLNQLFFMYSSRICLQYNDNVVTTINDLALLAEEKMLICRVIDLQTTSQLSDQIS